MKASRATRCLLIALLGASATIAGGSSAEAVLGDGFHFQFRHSGKCIDVPGASTAEGVKLDQYTCVDAANERFTQEPTSETPVAPGVIQIRNDHSRKCLNIANNNYQNNTPIVQWTCGPYSNEWFVRDTNTAGIPAGYALYRSAIDRRWCLNIRYAATQNGGALILYQCGNYNNEYIKIY
jgi:hypothetical protein